MKGFTLDIGRVREQLLVVQQTLMMLKHDTRAVKEVGKRTFMRNGHLVSRTFTKQVIRRGRELTKDEGKLLHRAKKAATLLCSMLALSRGKFHKSPLMRHPTSLFELATLMDLYALPPASIIPQKTEAVAEEPAAVQEVHVVTNSNGGNEK